MVIGGSPASNADIFFRIVATRMGAMLGQNLIVDYRPGAGGAIGAHITVKSPADGYTIMMVAAGFVMNPALTKNLPYNPARDFTALGLVADVPAGLVVHPSLPAADLKQLIALPRPAVEAVNGALHKVILEPVIRKAMMDNGADPVGNTPAQHDAFIKSEVAKWVKVVNEAGLKAE